VVGVKVVMDTSPLRMTRAGTARYIRNLLDRIEGIEPFSFGGAGRASVLGRELWWYPFRLSTLADADLLHCPTYYAPMRPRLPTVVTVHDLAVFRYPAAFGGWTRRFVPRAVPAMIRAATRVVAVSEFTASEVEQVVGVPRDRISVIPNAADAAFTPDGPSAEGEYALAVGTLEPRKNLGRAIEAAARVGIELRVAGAAGWGGVEARGAHVRWLGRVDDDELARQYRGAACLVYPSLYEGFGIPPLEAMACGTPVVASRGGAIEEVVGEAAALVDPLDSGDIAAGIERAVRDRAALRAAGLARARTFSWDETARRTRAVYEEAAA
jgi:glycosyltransferase involved in cell wall biosynthesis